MSLALAFKKKLVLPRNISWECVVMHFMSRSLFGNLWWSSRPRKPVDEQEGEISFLHLNLTPSSASWCVLLRSPHAVIMVHYCQENLSGLEGIFMSFFQKVLKSITPDWTRTTLSCVHSPGVTGHSFNNTVWLDPDWAFLWSLIDMELCPTESAVGLASLFFLSVSYK